MARRVRDAIAIEDEPIRDICGLLEENGVPILAVHYASNSFFGLSVAPESGGPAIVVNAWSRIPVERRIFSAAHELGHLLLHPATYDLCEVCDEEDIEESEREADQFAGYLLMPIRSFDREWEETAGLPFVERVLKVKRMFRVSYQTVLRRLIETERANESIWRVFRARYEKRYGARLAKTMEPKPLVDADFRADRLPRLVRAAIEKGKLSLGRAGEILGISLREMRELASEWSE
jgi:Zn-dependent peptidase ImmA (M78 family)